MLARYGISPKRSASLLDTFSCIFQGIIPYGAQMLVAISTCATLGYAISAFDIIPPAVLALPAVPVSVRQKVKRPVSHIYLRREPPFSRRRALGVMLPRYLYDAALWPLSAEIAM